MKRKIIIFLGSAMFSILMAGCNQPREFTDFLKLPKDKQIQQFHNFPIDKQIDYHLYAMSMEPSDYDFAEEIAKNGNQIIPEVLNRLKKEKGDSGKVNLLAILEYLCRKGSCEEAMPGFFSKIENEISKMHDPDWRRMAEKSLSYMKGDPVPLPQFPRVSPSKSP